jgi:hypothetical protein
MQSVSQAFGVGRAAQQMSCLLQTGEFILAHQNDVGVAAASEHDGLAGLLDCIKKAGQALTCFSVGDRGHGYLHVQDSVRVVKWWLADLY